MTALELVVAVILAFAVDRLAPLGDGDPFRGTLVILPFIVVGLRLLERRTFPAAPRTRPAVLLEGLALLGLVTLVLVRGSLGLAASDWFLAAGFLLLLAHRVVRLLLVLRRRFGVRLGRGSARPDAAFFFLPLLVYLALQPWMAEHRQPDGDEPYYLLVAHSLVHDFDVELGENYRTEDWRSFMERPISPQPGDPEGEEGEVYSRHNALLPLALAPAQALAGRAGAMTMMALFTAALAFMFLRLAGRYFGRYCASEEARDGTPRAGAVWLAYAIFAFAPPLLIYSYQIWVEVPAALLLTIGLDRVLAWRHGEAVTPKGVAALVVVLALLPLLKLRFALVAVPLAVLAVREIWKDRGSGVRGAAVVAGGLAAVLGGLLLVNYLSFGKALKINRLADFKIVPGSVADFARGALGPFYDAAFGLFACAPVWLLLLPALWLLVSRRERLAGDLAIFALPYLAAVATRFEWYGGWSPPFRYPLVLLPLFALALVPLLDRRHRPGLAALLAALGAVSLILALVWVVIPGWTYHFADGRTHLLDEASLRLGADAARFFPSFVRPRLATWIWPVASLLLVPLALAGRRRRFHAGSWGIAALLTALALGTVLATEWPSRVIEIEDPQVAKGRGHPFPGTWVVERPRYRSGWVLGPRGRVTMPVVAGGERVRLRIAVYVAKKEPPARLRLVSGEHLLAEIDIETRNAWHLVEAGPFDWTDGATLTLTGGGLETPGRVAVDRVEWDWR